nr:MAG TPA: major capsid protein [Caudoviricetes sp.]
MDKSLNELRDKIAELSRQANNMIENKGGTIWSEEEQTSFDNIVNQINAGKKQMASIEAMRENDAENFFKQVTNAKPEENGEQKAAFEMYFRKGAIPEISNAMSKGTDADGGYTVPEELASYVIDALKAFGGMRTAASVMSTESGVEMKWPTSDGREELGEIVGENAAVTEQAITFGITNLQVYKYSSKKLALSVELVRDSGIDIVRYVINRLATRIARVQNKHFTTGTGTGQPKGIVTAATTGVTGAISYDTMLQLKHSIDPAYRGRAAWMMSDAAVLSLALLKDTTGRPIWQPSMTSGSPDILLGQRIIVNNDMPEAKPIIYGDLGAYQIRDVRNSASLRRFDDSNFALNGQVGFCQWHRSGGNLLDTNAVKVFAVATSAGDSKSSGSN